uniref:AlNc14C8G1099 protein n=1 Tax=Albugo laibachii Nc14 TaxID=890382 RepID=F0W226_9STRA|nr:AlNc14C8G1099 [Albugo laibachii Nc14]|eukprot:CCA15105.1 AlNc14C8G1099 [Albugo laibachii Nc14]
MTRHFAMARNMRSCIQETEKEIEECKTELKKCQEDVTEVLKAVEDLTVQACGLHVRKKELSLDEEMIDRVETDAVSANILAQKRLREIGGNNSSMQKALQRAKADLERVREEESKVMKEEQERDEEHERLLLVLRQTREKIVILQNEYHKVSQRKADVDKMKM